MALGADVERTGELSAKRLGRAADAVAREVGKARKLGAAEITVLLTSPGRQARNGADLRNAIAARTGASVRLLSAAEEGRLGYAGAVAAAGVPGGSLAVCDAGGGSTQLAVGTGRVPSWVRSVDIGSLRLTRRLLAGRSPPRAELSEARAEVRRTFQELVPPLPRKALATGGTARALGRIVGRRLDAETLAARALGRVVLPGQADREPLRHPAVEGDRPPGGRADPHAGSAAAERARSRSPAAACARARRSSCSSAPSWPRRFPPRRSLPTPTIRGRASGCAGMAVQAGAGRTATGARPSRSKITVAPFSISSPQSSSSTSPWTHRTPASGSAATPSSAAAPRPSASSSRASTRRPRAAASGSARVHAAHVRARRDPVEVVALELLDQPLRLKPAPVVERPQGVVVVPVLAVARPGVPDDEQRPRPVVAEAAQHGAVAVVAHQPLGLCGLEPADLVHLVSG